LTRGKNEPAQIDLIDYQSMPDGKFNYVLEYQDHGIKFFIVCLLTQKTHIAVAVELINIFCIFGPPSILPSFKLIMGRSSAMVPLNITICSWMMKLQVIEAASDSFSVPFSGLLDFSSHMLCTLLPVLFRGYQQNKEFMARDCFGYL
jgi:hypothetical protein